MNTHFLRTLKAISLPALVLALASGTALAAPARATSGSSSMNSSKLSAGVLLGPTFLSDSLGTKLLVGIDADYRLHDNVLAGLYVTYNSNGALGSVVSSSLTTIAAEAKYLPNDVM